jgi:hypothetical protein
MIVDTREIERRVAEACPDPLAMVGIADIGPMFNRAPSWFYQKRVRVALDAAGFPRPVERGTYFRRDVIRFLICRTAGVDARQAAAPRPAPGVNPVVRRATARYQRGRKNAAQGVNTHGGHRIQKRPRGPAGTHAPGSARGNMRADE